MDGQQPEVVELARERPLIEGELVRRYQRFLADVRLEDGESTALDLGGAAETLQRPIALGPALLIALDAHKQALFRARWRDAFPETGGAAP